MPDSLLFSIGVDNLLEAIRPHGRDEVRFPRGLVESEARRHPSERLQTWFRRVVDRSCGGEPGLIAIEDNIAVLVALNGRPRLSYASIQTVIATTDLDDYYLDEAAQAQYLRLDLDYRTLGDPFSHPLAHVHVEGELSPRFALDGGYSGNIVIDYLEFIYRNYVPNKWLAWARRAWDRERSTNESPGESDRFSTVIQAFGDGQFHILREHAAFLGDVKRALRRRKDEAYRYHMEGADREILEYPSAR